MIRHARFAAFLPTVALALGVGGAVGLSAAAYADDPPPPAAPGTDEPGRHHDHDPAWAACKKQADDQKMERGDARRDFMKNCVKSAHAAPPAAT
jgi:hypothetical protein